MRNIQGMPTSRCIPATRVRVRNYSAEAELLKALGDPHRLNIVAVLAATPHAVCVCDLVDGLPIGQSSVSHHLAILRDAGIVTSERRGNWAYYTLVPGLRGRLRTAFSEILPAAKRLPRAS
jgi:ArsR family transcriptional regulator